MELKSWMFYHRHVWCLRKATIARIADAESGTPPTRTEPTGGHGTGGVSSYLTAQFSVAVRQPDFVIGESRDRRSFPCEAKDPPLARDAPRQPTTNSPARRLNEVSWSVGNFRRQRVN